jgi:hypothetical protein
MDPIVNEGVESSTAVPDKILERFLTTMEVMLARVAAFPTPTQQPQQNLVQQPRPTFELQQPPQLNYTVQHPQLNENVQ